MDIGIIGAGNIGSSLATLLAGAGHTVVVSNSRGPDTIAHLAGGPGDRVRVGTVAEAAAFGELVAEAIPFGRYRDLPVDALDGKIVVSASNYYPGRDGEMGLAGRVDTELVAEHLPGSRIVKAFNTIYYVHLQTQGDTGKALEDRRVIALAGDDADAKATVARLVEEIGFGPLDTGSLHEGGRRQSTDAPIYNADLTVAEARRVLAS